MTSALVNGKIYVIGGQFPPFNQNQIYDPVANTWSTGAVLPIPQYAMTSAVVNGKIYVIGGNHEGSHDNNQIYDPGTDSWSTGATLPVGQAAMTSAVVNGKIYVIGGAYSSSNNNQIYDPVANTWSTGAPLPVPQSNMTSAVVNGKIYVIGGFNGTHNNNQIYTPASQSGVGTQAPSFQNSLTVSPDPVRGYTCITWQPLSTERVTIRLLDILGRKVFEDARTSTGALEAIHVSIPLLPPGAYELELEQSGNIWRTQVILEQ